MQLHVPTVAAKSACNLAKFRSMGRAARDDKMITHYQFWVARVANEGVAMLFANCSKLVLLLLAISPVATTTAADPKARRFVPANLARFELVLGRLQLSSEYFRIGAAHERTTLANGSERARSISISTLRGKPTLQFRDTGGEEEISLSFKADQQVDISLTTGKADDRYTLVYHQSAEGPISLKIEFVDGHESMEFEVLSLWHLAMKEPQAFEQYVQPCLARLDPSWQFARYVTTIRSLMNNSLHRIDAGEVKRLIVQLDAELSVDRNLALSQLESMGIAAEQPLRKSLSTELSSQQETSVKRLLRTLQPTGNDNPMRVAVWLSSDMQ